MVKNIKTSYQSSSLQDSYYPMHVFSDGLKSRLEESQKVAEDIYNEVIKESPIIAQIYQSTQKKFNLVVDVGDDVLKKIERGAIRLTTDKSGRMSAQIRNANGTFGEKLPIRKEYLQKNIDITQVANSLQM